MGKAASNLPVLHLPRPALQLLYDLGHGRAPFTFHDAALAASRPPSTVARHLAALTDAGLIVRLRKEVYASPRKGAHALLLVEPDAYARRLLVLADVLDGLEIKHAFACLPVRRVLNFELTRPVVAIDLRGETPGDWLRHDAARLALEPAMLDVRERTFPTDAPKDGCVRRIRVLRESWALTLLTATADPRLVHAAEDAARALNLDPARVMEEAASFVVEEGIPKRVLPNTLVLPKELADSARSARTLHARRFLDEASAGGPHDG